MTIFRLSLLVAIFTMSALAEPNATIPLWPEGVPAESDFKLPEESIELKGPHQIEIMSNVRAPELTWYPAEKPNGTAVIVCPGGGYNILAYSHEGYEVCEWLNTLGVSAALLKYRVPRREGRPFHEAPLEDVHRAIGIIRTRAEEWKVNPKRVGILGFSAGGNLAAHAVTFAGERTYPTDPKVDSVDPVPNFGVLIYAAYLLEEGKPDNLNPDIKVTGKTPPTFLAVAHDDKRFVEGSARFYIEMFRNGRPCELHIFQKGGHGFGFDKTEEEIRQWPALAGAWMKTMGWLSED
ncbi:alpha/beta hydrolase [Verrucomicrobiales bacterium]|jgi:acetyl esterase/lipase|nr:alpha/beta hydrolase [Verrucomicrobiales bacterium]MDC3353075.1 alpha/beta hydrolase [Verrucomicrobiales bacterium]